MPIHSLSPESQSVDHTPDGDPGVLSLRGFFDIFEEIRNQPPWRQRADKEMDYADGNQLGSDILKRMQDLGIPPAVEPLVGPALEAVCGYEARTRKDWRVSADGVGSEDAKVAKALNHKLNTAERHSGADRACGAAFRPQAGCGMGWVEVSRENNPFALSKYRCQAIHRNEIFFDWLTKDDSPKMRDARYLVRRRWTDVKQVCLKFPRKKELILRVGRGEQWANDLADLEGGTTPDLYASASHERGWSIEEMEWRDVSNGRVCLFEVWRREWVSTIVLRTPDGRIVEYAKQKPLHVALVATGQIRPEPTVVPRMFLSYWMGPHKLWEGRSPYRHDDFPYVPFWGIREDRTGAPYGLIKGMIFSQDNVNSSISKIRWSLGARRVVRTKGIVKMTDEQLRNMVARPDADIILDPVEAAKPGAEFRVEQDEALNEQQFQMLEGSRQAIQRVSLVTLGFQGQAGTARSGVQESTQIEQTVQALARLMANFADSRAQVGELLLSLVIEDSLAEETVVIPDRPLKPGEQIALNVPQVDEATGLQYRTNDVERTRLKVALEDVPSTSSFRAQQLQALSETVKSLPPDVQLVVLPYLLNLTDVPDKDDIVKAIVEARGRETPEQIEQRIKEAVDRALKDAAYDLKQQELGLKATRQDWEIRKLVADTFVQNIAGFFSSSQAAAAIAANPALAPVMDLLVQLAGWQPPKPAGVDPNIQPPDLPAPAGGAAAALPPGVQPNTSPQQPAVPGTGMRGIETSRTTDGAAA